MLKKIFILIAVLGLSVGSSLHSWSHHADQGHESCQVCQISHQTLIPETGSAPQPGVLMEVAVVTSPTVFTLPLFVLRPPSRAPPL